jgi:hypothetical protein
VSIWTDLGFRDNPYLVAPLSANDEGNELLVGREAELSRLMTQIESLDTKLSLRIRTGRPTKPSRGPRRRSRLLQP